MRIVPFIISAVATTGLVIVLNMQLPSGTSKTPKLGFFLSPQYGFWQNAEPTDISYNDDIKISGVKNQVDVYFDERLVPHIYAQNNADAYYIQGFIHAKFRLWQMEFQTYVAGGRLSEIVGEERLATDKYFRRLGMVYGAENSLKEIEANPETKEACDSYTAGINAYIKSLKPNELPFEYKLLNYAPEPWTNLKTALFLKFMSWDLSGHGDDLTFTNARNAFGYDDYMKLFPNIQDTLDPIIPRGTVFESPSINIKQPANIDSAYFGRKDTITNTAPITPQKGNGSNNWAVAGSKTKSGRPILCNDPHLGLNLPSLWYEMQITTPEYSSYGATFPGSPAIIIGFNDSCAWGVTNSGRDVKDYYEIKFKDASMQEYWFDGNWKQTTFRKEIIKIKDKPDCEQKMAMTVFGPVMYDTTYKSDSKDGKYYAVRWKAHDASNELATFYKLDRVKNYFDYVDAISGYQCPGQNFVYASKSGDIAIRQQGLFVAKWKQQGDFVMPGTDSSYMWQGYIPAKENPQMANPVRGFVSSANQQSVDETYPYYLGRASNFPPYRGYIINRKLGAMNNITPDDMKQMQTDNYNVFAEICRPVLLKYLDETKLNADEKKYLDIFKSWNLRNDVAEKAPTIFKVFWDSVEVQTWGDEFAKIKVPVPWPDESVLIESFMKDSAYKFADDINTPNKVETIADVVLAAYQKAVKQLVKIDKENKLEWAKFKGTHIDHLLRKLPSLNRLNLNIGGGAHIINATTEVHGPSWRMVVHLTDNIEAYGVYPGGQNGNPGSKYYDNFIDTWAAGRYYNIVFLKKQEARKDERMKWHITFING
jgi:penicillin amidase